MRGLALPRLSAELALAADLPLDGALADVLEALPSAPRQVRVAHAAAQRGNLPAALDALGYGKELAALIVGAPAHARALSLRSAAIPELGALLVPLIGVLPLLLTGLLVPRIAASVVGRALQEVPPPAREGPGGLLLLADLSEGLWRWYLPWLPMVVTVSALTFLVALGSPPFRARLFRRSASALEDARRLAWGAVLRSRDADPAPALRHLSANAAARVSRSRARTVEDFERLSGEAVLAAQRGTARTIAALRFGFGALGALGAATVMIYVSTRLVLQIATGGG